MERRRLRVFRGIMIELQKWIGHLINTFFAWSFKRTADRQNRQLYDKSKVKYTDGDNT